MKRSISQWIWIVPVIAGVVLAVSAGSRMASSGAIRHSHNVFAIQRSAYGRLLARLSETTVDRVWHLGVEQIVPHNMTGHEHSDHDHEHSDHDHEHSDHDHEHSDHDHDHADHDHDHADHDHDHSHADHDHEHGDHDHEVAGKASPTSGSAIKVAKEWFNDMRVAEYKRTNPYSLNERHLATVKRDIEEMLLRSYKMDPTHYGVYNSYHLFLTTHEFGGNEAKKQQARKIAQATIAEVFKEHEDPEPWLTAASAAMNLFLLETESYSTKKEQPPLQTLKEYESRIGYCLQEFDRLYEKAVEAGTWKNLSTERQLEISNRQRFATRTFAQFGAMIARNEAIKDAKKDGEVASSQAKPEEE